MPYRMPAYLLPESPISQAIAKHIAETPDAPWLGLDYTTADGVRHRSFQLLNAEGRAIVAADYENESWVTITKARGITDAQRAAFMTECHRLVTLVHHE